MNALRSFHAYFQKFSFISIGVFGALLGIAYYMLMESEIPKETQCSYMTNWTTDAAAFAWGFIVMWLGYIKYNDKILFALGWTIIVEHVLQLVDHKTSLRK